MATQEQDIEELISEQALEAGTSLWKDAWYRLIRNKAALISGIYVVILLILAILTPWIAPYEFDAVNYDKIGAPPSFEHWLGADVLGRDLFTRCLYGLRISLAVGFVATIVSFFIGIIYGAVAGYCGGKLDAMMMRFVDIMYALPYIFLVIILMTLFGRNIILLFIALGAVEWLTMARIVRGQILSLKHKEFIEAAHSIGVRKRHIIFRHLIPNAMGPIIVYSTLTVPQVILAEAFLSFLGLGVQAPMASLGSLASDGAQAMELYSWLIIFPGLLLATLLFALNYLGDGLRDALDPRMKQ
ncbi:MAG: peptide ABC transporter permease [Deltaproteobacteria bacterium RIFCSPLOWO2_02_FULL_44_10]|nr:MAG: peptide ABC transporter permease [Deltaproteobacteria bacterium RIFCSPHIGHO2_02_FULL_44_16]OGQ47283.1 MAG: peptide ABC transporter permease [Deltaproteobacteria bacterium RIFCSPLOWO2_02_FULL_44_10]